MPTNIKLHMPTFGEEEIAAVVDVLRSTQVTSGDKVREFEAKFGEHAVMCNSGSSANLLAVAAMTNPVVRTALRPGDEVIVSALSWSTTVWPLVQYGLVPVIVDIDPETLNIDPVQVEAAITPRTRAIMVVHVYGNPCDMGKLMEIAFDHGLRLIEDCCEALGAEYRGRPVGGYADFHTYSFYFSHHITTLEGGMVIARTHEQAELLRVLRAHGWTRDMKNPPDVDGFDPRFVFVNAGYNLRASEVNAAIGLVQWPKLAGFVEARRQTARKLQEVFLPYEHYLHTQRDIGGSSWFGFPVIVDRNATFGTAGFRQYFEDRRIETRAIICGNIARQPGMQLWPHTKFGNLANADHVMQNGFSLPCHQDMNDEAVDRIADAMKGFFF